MQVNTKAIVLYLQKHSDRAGILHLYTREHGRMSYLAYGVSGRKASVRRAAMQPFSVVEIEAVHREERTLQDLKKLNLSFVPVRTDTDIRRRTVGVFIAEVLLRTLTHPLPDPALFDWIESLARELDTTDTPENLHLYFMTHFTDRLGITPDWEADAPLLDMFSGENLYAQPLHGAFFSAEEMAVLRLLVSGEMPLLSHTLRRTLLFKLCRYYELQLPGFSTPHSLAVLEELFD